jgi:hypothetical protein
MPPTIILLFKAVRILLISVKAAFSVEECAYIGVSFFCKQILLNLMLASGEYAITPEDGRVRPKHVDE